MDKELMPVKKIISIACALIFFTSLVAYPDIASDSAAEGLKMCAGLIIPTLFPFFVATKLVSELGFAQWLGRVLAPVCRRLFNVSGSGGTAFIIGVTAGYPMGASYIASLREKGEVSKTEAERLLIFCNNSGPSFIIGAAGIGVFSSSAIGFFLYTVHIIAAVVGGIIFAPNDTEKSENLPLELKPHGFAVSFTNAIKASVNACLSICGFIVAFSVLTGILEKTGVFSVAAKLLSAVFGMELIWSRAFFCGLLELGNGIGAMSGLGAEPLNLALAAFILGWGGVSVHFQTLSVLGKTDIKTARYIIGRFIIALIGSALALLGAAVMF